MKKISIYYYILSWFLYSTCIYSIYTHVYMCRYMYIHVYTCRYIWALLISIPHSGHWSLTASYTQQYCHTCYIVECTYVHKIQSLTYIQYMYVWMYIHSKCWLFSFHKLYSVKKRLHQKSNRTNNDMHPYLRFKKDNTWCMILLAAYVATWLGLHISQPCI